MTACGCTEAHERERIVLTGGPGAGKTAVLEMVRHTLCEHVLILPEAATIVFGGGFPRREERESRRAAQRAIFHVQRELEAIGDGDHRERSESARCGAEISDQVSPRAVGERARVRGEARR